MRAVSALLVLVTGCIAAEPGQSASTDSASQRKACTDLEGLTFQIDGQSVTFNPDDAEYSIYVDTAADGTQVMGLAQCISNGLTNAIYLDGAVDHHAARADIRASTLRWTDGRVFVSN